VTTFCQGADADHSPLDTLLLRTTFDVKLLVFEGERARAFRRSTGTSTAYIAAAAASTNGPSREKKTNRGADDDVNSPHAAEDTDRVAAAITKNGDAIEHDETDDDDSTASAPRLLLAASAAAAAGSTVLPSELLSSVEHSSLSRTSGLTHHMRFDRRDVRRASDVCVSVPAYPAGASGVDRRLLSIGCELVHTAPNAATLPPMCALQLRPAPVVFFWVRFPMRSAFSQEAPDCCKFDAYVPRAARAPTHVSSLSRAPYAFATSPQMLVPRSLQLT
jgi:hypothetical protein